MKQIIRFGIIGTIGFGVDIFILMIGVNIFLLSIEVSRLISFFCAVFVTWLLNRTFTFAENKLDSKKKEYSLYLIIQTIGALLNYGIFILLIYFDNFFKTYLIITLAITSLIAMFFNFLTLKKLVFNSTKN